MRDNKIEIREKIQFEYDKAIIREVSFGLLAEIADVIKKHPHIKKLRIEGHASAEGEDQHNLVLSDKRAKAVMAHLVERGAIPKEMLVAKGFGETRPIAPNDTEVDREKNRRVEFNIIEQAVTKKKVEIDAATGQEKVVEEVQENLKAPDADEPGRSDPHTSGATERNAGSASSSAIAHPSSKPVAHGKAPAGTKPAKAVAKAATTAKPQKTARPVKPVAIPKAAKPAAPQKPPPAKAAKKR